MMKILNKADQSYNLNLLTNFRKVTNFLTLKRPTFKRNYHNLTNLKENELLQDIKFIKKDADDMMIGSNPMDKTYNKWLAYAKRNDGKKYIFTEKTNRYGQTSWKHISNKEVSSAEQLFKQASLEKVPNKTNHVQQAKQTIEKAEKLANDKMDAKQATKLIDSMFNAMYNLFSQYDTYITKANLLQQGTYYSNNLVGDADFTVKKTLFGIYSVDVKQGNKRYYSKNYYTNSVMMIAENFKMDLLEFTQDYNKDTMMREVI